MWWRTLLGVLAGILLVYPGPAAATTPGRRPTDASGTSLWTPTGCGLPSWSPSPGSADRDGAARLLTALAARLSTVRLVWADGGYSGRLLPWADRVLHQVIRVVKRSDDTAGFTVLPRRWVVEGTFAWIRQTPALRPRLRDPPRQPRSNCPHRDDHDHVTAPHTPLSQFPDALLEAVFAHLCGVAPIPASIGRTHRRRLNRGGDRAANNALHTITLCRLRYHFRTYAYVA